MGYYSRLHGAITIDPPLTMEEMKTEPFLSGDDDQFFTIDVQERIEQGTGEFAGAEIVFKAGVRVLPIEGEWSFYEWEEQLDAFQARYPTRTFYGQITRTGWEQGDVGRVVVRNSSFCLEKAELRWPDGKLVEDQS